MNNKDFQTTQFSAITLHLTPKALLWLNGITHGIPHLTIYNELLFSMATDNVTLVKRGNDVPLKALEVEASANGLGERWHIGRKVMTRLLDEMEQLKLIKLSRSKLTSIATMTAVVDYDAIAPPFSNPPSDQSKAEQQNIAQPNSNDGAPEAEPPVSTEVYRADGTSVSVVTDEPPAQTSFATDGRGSPDTSYSHPYKPKGDSSVHTVSTLFDGMNEQPMPNNGA